jgi:hypothetical protein
VVERGSRGRGLGARLIEALIAGSPGRILMITGRKHAPHYSAWCPISAFDAPASVMRNYCLGQIIGGAFALLQRRPINHLAILDRTS